MLIHSCPWGPWYKGKHRGDKISSASLCNNRGIKEEIRNVISHGVLYNFCNAEPRKAIYLVDPEEVADKLLQWFMLAFWCCCNKFPEVCSPEPIQLSCCVSLKVKSSLQDSLQGNQSLSPNFPLPLYPILVILSPYSFQLLQAACILHIGLSFSIFRVHIIVTMAIFSWSRLSVFITRQGFLLFNKQCSYMGPTRITA